MHLIDRYIIHTPEFYTHTCVCVYTRIRLVMLVCLRPAPAGGSEDGVNAAVSQGRQREAGRWRVPAQGWGGWGGALLLPGGGSLF